ncbi:acetoacetate--CoA ligase [Modestobacter versicolor]|uniref:Acetoacetate--CoA ligase n=1 Tax=Modestobacter versicolor TaxID=429133 RepID=A0A323V580_9ACTN|nr:acetoacetate--CoA ligase [Modestobacter versicolor]MBB3677014.1 acetoacetyl-CoA synthetase [Modestobacter versicolor]PZA19764.1 acetoacetate--CoA ligase [Modestobacter versicolor]
MTADPALLLPEARAGGPGHQLAAFRERCEAVAGHPLPTATALHAFSVERYRDFWGAFLDWSGLAWTGRSNPVCTDDDVRTARFFPEVRLNYAENLLRPLPDAGDCAAALTSVHADGTADRYTRGELRAAVERTSAVLHGLGVRVGDRVVAIAPNHAGVAVAALAVAALGATLSTATPDMGPTALLGRFGQVRPRVLLVDRVGMARDGVPAEEALRTLVAGLPQVELLVVLDGDALPAFPGVTAVRLAELLAALAEPVEVPEWPRLAFDHPLWTMFSSGTTGPPKAIVHGAGGALLEHVKEHRLHGDLHAGDVLYFHTTTAWMMWNWQLSALAVGAHVVVYDGPVAGPETLWELVAEHGVTVFGTSPAYLQLCQDEGYRPRDAVALPALRSVLSTGAVLHDWQFDWLADAVGPLPVQSISGGTDIIGCFVLGHPEQPVRRGRSQSLGLGLDVAALDEDGAAVLGEPGELVCRRPFPSRPLGFLDDEDGARFGEAYFSQHPGVWTHGDMIEIDDDGSARLMGRSDGVLNIDGVRIGPSEIYTIVRRLPEVQGALAVEQQDPADRGSTRLVLLVVLQPGAVMDDALAQRIRSELRREGSAAHVPSVVLAVDELPTTHNGKFSERAARDALNGVAPRNLAALRNPGSLAAIAAAAQQRATAAARPAGSDEPADVVRRVFAEVLGSAVSDSQHFFDAGGTSRQSMTLLRRLRLELGRPLPMEDFLADPTVSGVLVALSRPAAPQQAITTLRPGRADQPPLHLVHGAFGDVDSFQYLVEHLDVSCRVYGVSGSLAAPDGSRRPVTEVAADHVAEIVAAHPTGPVSLAGFSFGGLVAYEMARQLTAMGRQVAFLGLLDVRPPTPGLTRAEQRVKRLAAVAATLTPGLRVRTPAQAIADLFRHTPRSAEAAEEAAAAGSYEQYRWGPYAGPVTFYRVAKRIPVFEHFMYAWRRVAPDLTVVDSPGAHHDMLSREHAVTLAAQLSEALRRVELPAG